MKFLLIALINLNVLTTFVYSRDVCYGELGCFTDSYPFSGSVQRPIALLPDSPERVAVRFLLHTRKVSAEVISYKNISANFDPALKTKFIIHGFLDFYTKQWIVDMRKALLVAENLNVILVDWSKGNGFPYTQATANTQIVGAEIARLIQAIIFKTNANINDFHLIGHSLGSHISGYAGARLSGKLGRITGLDPAGPYFENTDIIVRLDPSDAKFVDTIHSDGTANLKLGLGLMQAIGHADFYPNGGKDQPKCTTTSTKLLGAIFNLVQLDAQGIEDSVACSHFAANHFFTDSINTCKYTSYKCASKSDFDSGNCVKCTKGCNKMGYWASPDKDVGTLYLNTQPPTPTGSNFCQQYYSVNLYSDRVSGLTQARGKFTVYFKTSQATSSTEVLDDSSNTFQANDLHTALVALAKPLDSTQTINSIFISYTKTSSLVSGWLYDSSWSFKFVDVLNGETQLVSRYCPTQQIIKSGQTVEFKKC